MTHLHFDHASGIGQFPAAEFVVSRREYDAAGDGLLKGYIGSHLQLTSNWRTVDLDAAPAAEGFDHVHDVLGDGSVRMAFTPGHTHGHCSILLRTAGGPLLLTGDAAYAKRSIQSRWEPITVTGDVSEYRDSLEKIIAWTGANPDAQVICGHDPWDRADLERDY